MSRTETHKLIELIVNGIDDTITINSISAIPSTSTFEVFTDNTKWVLVGRYYTIGGEDYKVIDITPNTSFIVEKTASQPDPTGTSLNVGVPFYYHGTFNFVNQERTAKLFNTENTPFIYFNEPSNDVVYASELDARDRTSDCEMYFMQRADFDNWSNEKHYYYAISAMGNLIAAFINSAKNMSHVGELEDFGTESHVKWGVVNQNGHSRNLFNENLSGKKLDIQIPFLTMPCSFDPYNPPSTGECDIVINFDGTEVYNATITDDTTINIVFV